MKTTLWDVSPIMSIGKYVGFQRQMFEIWWSKRDIGIFELFTIICICTGSFNMWTVLKYYFSRTLTKLWFN